MEEGPKSPLTKEQRDEIGAWVARVTGKSELTCSLCDGERWRITGFVVLPVSLQKRDTETRVRVSTLAISCSQCGHILQFAETSENPLPDF